MMEVYANSESEFALILFDVDHFKSINDTYGHAMGDKALIRTVSTIKRCFRSMDSVFRIGGDEIAVTMVDVNPEMRPVIESKLTALSEELSHSQGDIPAISLSIGVVFFEIPFTGESIYKRADKALYRVKESGRGAFAFDGDK